MKNRFIAVPPKILDDPKIGMLSDHLFRRWIEMMLAFVDSDNLDISLSDTAWQLHTSNEDIEKSIKELSNAGLLDRHIDTYGYDIPFSEGYYYGVKWDYTSRWNREHAEILDFADVIGSVCNIHPDDLCLIQKYYTWLQTNKDAHYFIEKAPENPGVYFFFDDMNELIYIGSSKYLHRRLQQSFRERNGAENVKSIAYIETNDETLARYLEASQIMKYKPKMNISYPVIQSGYGRDVDAYKLPREEVQTWPNNG